MEVIVLAIVAAVAYYLYRTLPSWFRQGYNTAKAPHWSAIQQQTRTVEEPQSDDAKKKGDAFEQFITTKFPRQYYRLEEWRSDKGYVGVYAEGNKKPDLEYTLKKGNQRFAIECKFRSNVYDDFVVIAKDGQLERYKGYSQSQRLPVFIALGLGGAPENPTRIFVIPVDKLSNKTVNLKYYSHYEIHSDRNLFYKPEIGRIVGSR